MRRSALRSPSDRATAAVKPGHPCRPSRPDAEQGVSEVVGFLLIFGILSIVLVLSMLTFATLHDRTRESVVHLQAESVAQRVAAASVGAALFAEQHGTASTYRHELDLPARLEGQEYEVRLENGPDQVRIVVPALGIDDVTAPLFAAAAGPTFSVCAGSEPGGPLTIRFGPRPAPSPSPCIFLEATA